jgi:hypothetical protein
MLAGFSSVPARARQIVRGLRLHPVHGAAGRKPQAVLRSRANIQKEGPMSVHHNRQELLAEIQHMPEGCFTDGVLIDVPKRRRRAQAMTDAEVRIKWPKEQKKRFATQYNFYVETCGKDLGIELLLQQLEALDEEALRAKAEGKE